MRRTATEKSRPYTRVEHLRSWKSVRAVGKSCPALELRQTTWLYANAHTHTHLQTATLCRQQGLQFIPLVPEAVTRGWGREALKAWRQLGTLLAHRTGDTSAATTARLLQCLSVALQQENARAILRRLGSRLSTEPVSSFRRHERLPALRLLGGIELNSAILTMYAASRARHREIRGVRSP